MYTVILGGGLIGTGIARWLIEAGSEVTIFEINADKVDDKDYEDFVAEATALSIALG